MRRRGIARALIPGLLAVSLACGGGGGDGGGGGGPTDPSPLLVFTPSGGGSADSVFLVTGTGTTLTQLVLELRVQSVSDLYGVSFDLAFPSALLVFEGADEGPFLNLGGIQATSLQAVESPAGNLVVGLTRLGPVTGVDGSGVLLRLRFRAVASGNGSFRFDSDQAFNSQGAPSSQTSWFGGSIQIIL